MKDLYANLEKLMTIRDALIITFGWLLGLLAPAITNAIKDRRELNVVKIALLAELRELQYNLVLIAFRIESRYGTLDHTFLNWVKNILNKYVGINSTEKISKTIETLLKLKAIPRPDDAADALAVAIAAAQSGSLAEVSR